jgi:Flp pilus assembly protein TadD
LVEQALAARIRVLGDRHPDTLTARANLATAYSRAGRIGEAIALQTKVLADRIEVLGPGHPDSLTSLADLAESHRSAGRLEDAIALFREAIAGANGPGHPNVEVWTRQLETMEAQRQ